MRNFGAMTERLLNRRWEFILPTYGLGHVLGTTFGSLFRVVPPPRTIAVYTISRPDGGLTHTLTTALFLLAGATFGAILLTKWRARRTAAPDPTAASTAPHWALVPPVGLGVLAGLVPVMLDLFWHPAKGPIKFWPLQDWGWMPPIYEMQTTLYVAVTTPLLFLSCAILGFVAALGVGLIQTMARRLRPRA
jgi:hypothetical protein